MGTMNIKNMALRKEFWTEKRFSLLDMIFQGTPGFIAIGVLIAFVEWIFFK